MDRIRCEIRIRGRVQGLGFRPWAARHAMRLGLGGHVCNEGDALRVVLEGPADALEAWWDALRREPPPAARIEGCERAPAPCQGETRFCIAESRSAGAPGAPRVALDEPICDDCVGDLFDPASRRYRYAFTHCAGCGPRASVLRDLPWDRARTTLACFPPCGRCCAEYDDPDDRRFHAESIACPDCGPRLRLEGGGRIPPGDSVEAAVQVLRAGGIVALKGYGGHHLLADATRESAVARLRKRKGRPRRPFAVMTPDAASARRLVHVAACDEVLLAGPLRPVLLARRRSDAALAASVAPGVPDLGVALPHAPLHWLLFYGPGTEPGRGVPRLPALLFTSANRSGEPTLADDEDARDVLAELADCALVHDRAVARPSDDTVFRASAHGPIPVRLSRGTSPLVLSLPAELAAAEPVLAVGGDLKCAPALLLGNELWLAEHVGDLSSVAAADALEARIDGLCRLAGVEPSLVAHDLHPDYVGTGIASGLAEKLGVPSLAVQHHHAHALACLVDAQHPPPGLVWVLDGAGYGPDGTIWGGELLFVHGAGYERVAHLETLPLPGGDAAAREPWRMAAVWLRRAFPDGAPPLAWHARVDALARRRVEAIAERGIASPATSSCGRLFDAVASLVAGVDRVSFEGEAALALEALAARAPSVGDAETGCVEEGPGARSVAVAGLVRTVAESLVRQEAPERIARDFHRHLGQRLARVAAAEAQRRGLGAVGLSGGCVQNRLLLAALCEELEARGIAALVHRRVPPSDGGLAVGQALAAASAPVF